MLCGQVIKEEIYPHVAFSWEYKTMKISQEEMVKIDKNTFERHQKSVRDISDGASLLNQLNLHCPAFMVGFILGTFSKQCPRCIV